MMIWFARCWTRNTYLLISYAWGCNVYFVISDHGIMRAWLWMMHARSKCKILYRFHVLVNIRNCQLELIWWSGRYLMPFRRFGVKDVHEMDQAFCGGPWIGIFFQWIHAESRRGVWRWAWTYVWACPYLHALAKLFRAVHYRIYTYICLLIRELYTVLEL
jgi:hypothetical protein